jgi:tubulin delta
MASDLTIAVGQCGLQVYDATLSIIHRGPDYESLSSSLAPSPKLTYQPSYSSLVGTVRRAHFHKNGRARAVFVDSEPRVLNGLRADPRKPWVAAEGMGCVHETSGRGNNWAQGYLQSDTLVERAMESSRQEIEACDWYRGCTLYHALGGGTGSGSGTRIARAMRDRYEKCSIASVCVAPSATNESPVYGYNTMLSLWQLQEHADGMCMFTNDDLHARAQRAVIGNQEDQTLILPKKDVQIPLSTLNNQCAISMAGLVYPTCAAAMSPFRSTCMYSMISDVAPVSDLKYIDVRSSVYTLPSGRERQRRRLQNRSTDSWTRTAKLLHKAIPRFDVENERIQTLHQRIVVRGHDEGTQSPWRKSGLKITKKTLSMLNPVSWNLDLHMKEGKSIQCVARSEMDAFDGRSITVMSNRTAAASLLRRLHNKTAEMFSANAYVHWYEEQGCDRDVFVEAFESCAKTVEAYRGASEQEARGAILGVLETPKSRGQSQFQDPYDVLHDSGVSQRSEPLMVRE